MKLRNLIEFIGFKGKPKRYGYETTVWHGEPIGEVIEVYELRPADLLEIRGADKTFMIPYISQMVQSVSVADNRIVLDPPPGLLEV